MRMPGGIAGTQVDRPAQQHDAPFRIAGQAGDDALKRQRRRVVGRRGQNVGANAGRLVQPLPLRGGLRARQ